MKSNIYLENSCVSCLIDLQIKYSILNFELKITFFVKVKTKICIQFTKFKQKKWHTQRFHQFVKLKTLIPWQMYKRITIETGTFIDIQLS